MNTIQQEHFLLNEHNKTRLFHFLTQKIASRGIETKVATGDVNTNIMRCGIIKATDNPTGGVIGEDVELVLLLVVLAPPDSNIYSMKPGRGKV